jgi:hypothetical protein
MSGASRSDDLFAIHATPQRHGQAVDSLRSERFDVTFSSDAELDDRAAGGPCGSRDAIRDWLTGVDGDGDGAMIPDPNRSS